MKISEAARLLKRMGRGTMTVGIQDGEPFVLKVEVSDYQLPYLPQDATEAQKEDRKAAIRRVIKALKGVTGKLAKSAYDSGDSKFLTLKAQDPDGTVASMTVYGICTRVGTKKVLKKIVKVLTPAVAAVTEEVEELVEVPVWDCSIQDRMAVEAAADKEEVTA